MSDTPVPTGTPVANPSVDTEGSDNTDNTAEMQEADSTGEQAKKPANMTQEEWLEYKADGATHKFKFDKEEVRKILPKAHHFDKSLRTLAEERKAMAAERAQLQEVAKLFEDPRALLSRLPPEQVAEYLQSYVQEQIAASKLTPEQRQIQQMQRENEELRSAQEQREQEAREYYQQQIIQRQQTQIMQDFNAAMKNNKVPSTEENWQEVAKVWREMKEAGVPFDSDLIVAHAKNNIEANVRRLEESVTKGGAKELYEKLPEPVLKALLKERIARLEAKGAKPKQVAPSPKTTSTEEDDSNLTYAERTRRLMRGY